MALDLPSFLGPPRDLPRPPLARALWRSFAERENGKEIGFSMLVQEATNWCWSAVTQAVVFHLHGQRHEQPVIATRHVRSGSPNANCVANHGAVQGGTCERVCTKPCNAMHKVRVVLEEWQLRVTTLSEERAVSFEAIQRQIGQESPVVCRIDFGGGVGHFICVTGWRLKGVKREVLVHDPRDLGLGQIVQEACIPYSELVSHYQSQGYIGRNNYAYAVQRA